MAPQGVKNGCSNFSNQIFCPRRLTIAEPPTTANNCSLKRLVPQKPNQSSQRAIGGGKTKAGGQRLLLPLSAPLFVGIASRFAFRVSVMESKLSLSPY